MRDSDRRSPAQQELGPGAADVPGLTSVHVDAEAHGRLSARFALDLDTDDPRPPPARIVVRQAA
ncbi:hypothetical protein ACLGIH_34600 [Streptomyces sp. HMX87]|uniref:hypothetical protein n=1 Tax=Streptomyces sp. HMX87 TaxID=3390849 RepID=UPI003A8C56CD